MNKISKEETRVDEFEKLYKQYVNAAISLIEVFLSDNNPNPVISATDSIANARERNTITLVLPRQRGSTKISQQLAMSYRCLIVCATHGARKGILPSMFSDLFIERYRDEPPVACLDDLSLESLLQNSITSNEYVSKKYARIRQALSESNIIVFDGSRSYRDNKIVKDLVRTFCKTHRFIFL